MTKHILNNIDDPQEVEDYQYDLVGSLQSVCDTIAHDAFNPMMDFEEFANNLEEYSYLVCRSYDGLDS